MRTVPEIVERIKKVRGDDFFGVRTCELLALVPFEDAKQFLKPDADISGWELDKRTIAERVASYMDFAWDKANGRRGLSASRSIDHFREMLWLDGHDFDAMLDADYEFYGKPLLVFIAELYGFDWRKHDDGQWGNDDDGMSISVERRDGLIRDFVARATEVKAAR